MKAKGVNFANFSQINICNTQVSNKARTTDAERGNSLQCTAENSIPIPNF